MKQGGLTWRSQVGVNPVPIPHPTNLALFGHKITLYRIPDSIRGLILLQGASNRSKGLSPPSPLTLTTAGRLWGSTSSAVSLIVITGWPPYAVVYRRRSCFSGRCRTYLERSAAARHVCALAACFSQSSEDAPLQTLLSVTPPSVFVVPVKWLVIIGHVNRSFYLLTILLTSLRSGKTYYYGPNWNLYASVCMSRFLVLVA